MLLKNYRIITVLVVVMMIPALAFSANKFAPSAAVAQDDNTIVVGLNITNDDGVMAMDIPLTFSEGVTLKEVTFENTRVEYFDLKVSNIDNKERSVVIGLINQLSPAPKPALEAGEGPVANLVFELVDPTVREIRLEKNVTQRPAHDLVFVYNTRSEPGQLALDEVRPDFEAITVALSSTAGNLPTEYALDQNYPNPFNPDTHIGFALPNDSRVQLTVYNVLGQHVRTLIDGEMPAGYHDVLWDGNDADGSSVASGVYFYRISAQGFESSKKMMLLK
jgi:hypothetical protein